MLFIITKDYKNTQKVLDKKTIVVEISYKFQKS
jgi:hypothetical protein